MIKIETGPSIKLDCKESIYISFPYDEKIISIIRNQLVRWWHPDLKVWELPKEAEEDMKEKLGLKPTKPNLSYTEKVLSNVTIPDSFEFKTSPFKHQKEGLKYGLGKNKFLLADEQGLGKTKQVIDIAIAKKIERGYKHCLIICGVNGLKWNWQDEVEKHSDEESMILGTRINTLGKTVIPGNFEKAVDLENLGEDSPYFLITNIETLRYSNRIETKNGKKKTVYPIRDYLEKLTKNGTIDMVAVDEIHKCKNPSSLQGKALLKIKSETRIAITGTPLMNSPLDLFIVFKWLGYDKHSFYQFKDYHCIMGGFGGHNVVGYKHLPELQDKLDRFMIRRLKKDVLDLPPKVRSLEYVEMGSKQTKIYNQVRAEIKEDIDKIKISPNPLAQLIRLRQATADTSILSSSVNQSVKLDRLEELVQEVADNGGKAIIFSNWTSVTTPTMKRLKRFNPAIITGGTKNRVKEQKKFMEDDNCKCIVGTIGAMGTGLTLTKATTVIFLDSPWNRALKDQAEDRAHRIGTDSTINIITLVCKGTIDERIEEIINKKGKMSDIMVDNEGTFTPEILDYLIS